MYQGVEKKMRNPYKCTPYVPEPKINPSGGRSWGFWVPYTKSSTNYAWVGAYMGQGWPTEEAAKEQADIAREKIENKNSGVTFAYFRSLQERTWLHYVPVTQANTQTEEEEVEEAD